MCLESDIKMIYDVKEDLFTSSLQSGITNVLEVPNVGRKVSVTISIILQSLELNKKKDLWHKRRPHFIWLKNICRSLLKYQGNKIFIVWSIF